MFVYYLTILFFGFLAFGEQYIAEQSKKQFTVLALIVSWGLLCVQIGLRWETGSDWPPYKLHFDERVLNPDYPYIFEPGYEFLTRLCARINEHYSFFLLIQAMIFYGLVLRFLYKMVPFPILSLLLFYAFMMGMVGSNRQLLSLAFGLTGIVQLVRGKKLLFWLLVITAFLFHNTGILFLFYYFLRREIKMGWLLAVVAICFIVGQTSITYGLFSLGGALSPMAETKAQAYLFGAEQTGASEASILGVLKRLAFFTCFALLRNKMTKSYPNYTILFNGYFIGICFFLLFYKTLPVMVSRGSIFFNVHEPFLLASVLLVFRDELFKFFAFMGIVAVSFLLLNQSIAAYPQLFDPYISIFYNQGYYRTF